MILLSFTEILKKEKKKKPGCLICFFVKVLMWMIGLLRPAKVQSSTWLDFCISAEQQPGRQQIKRWQSVHNALVTAARRVLRGAELRTLFNMLAKFVPTVSAYLKLCQNVVCRYKVQLTPSWLDFCVSGHKFWIIDSKKDWLSPFLNLKGQQIILSKCTR